MFNPGDKVIDLSYGTLGVVTEIVATDKAGYPFVWSVKTSDEDGDYEWIAFEDDIRLAGEDE